MAQKEMSRSWRGKTALVTGASSGIGAAVSRCLAREGLSVILVARREDRLHSLVQEICAAGGAAEALPADLSSESDRVRIAERVREAGGLHVLVNNAGQGWYGFYDDMPWDVARDLLAVNIGAVTHLTRLLLPGMLAQGQGRIVNIGSMVGGFPNQGVAVYAGSKAYLDAFTTSLFRELHGTGVTVSVLRPGPVASEFFQASIEKQGGSRVPGEQFAISPERVAGAVWSLVRRPRRYAYVPWFVFVSPWFEMGFGWIVDLLGPLLLGPRTESRP